jgi:hypothetical protein
MTADYQPRYKWTETWPGEGKQDFVAIENGEPFGRIQLDEITHNRQGTWKWNATHVAWAKQHPLPHGGWADTAREASRMVEEYHDRLKALHGR